MSPRSDENSTPKDGFEEVAKLAQYWKPRPRITLVNMVLKSTFMKKRASQSCNDW